MTQFLPLIPHRCHRSESAGARSAPPRTRCYCRYRCSDLRQTELRVISVPRVQRRDTLSASEFDGKKQKRKKYIYMQPLLSSRNVLEKE
jgi:hypothetical protein